MPNFGFIGEIIGGIIAEIIGTGVKDALGWKVHAAPKELDKKAEAHLRAGRALLRKGLYKDAEMELRAAWELDINIDFFERLGADERETVERDLTDALRAYPDLPNALIVLGRLRGEFGRLTESRSDVRRD